MASNTRLRRPALLSALLSSFWLYLPAWAVETRQHFVLDGGSVWSATHLIEAEQGSLLSARVAGNSVQRKSALASRQHHYNWHRPHSGIGGVAPMYGLNPSGRNNLLTLHTYSVSSVSTTTRRSLRASPASKSVRAWFTQRLSQITTSPGVHLCA